MAAPAGFGAKMEFDDAGSSSSLSPPISPHNDDAIRVAYPSTSHPGSASIGGVAAALSAVPATAAAANSRPPTSNGTTTDKPKRQRKKKDVGPDGKPVADDKPKEKKPRKPREPKGKPAADKPQRKRKSEAKVELKSEGPKCDQDTTAPASSRQPTITDMVHPFQPSPLSTAATAASAPPQAHQKSITESFARNGLQPPPTKPSTPRPLSSGQVYDPIRGSTMESAPRPSLPSTAVTSAQTTPHVNRASASPSIASLIDPPALTSNNIPASSSPQARMRQPSVSQPSPMLNPTFNALSVPPPGSSPMIVSARTLDPAENAMDIDVPTNTLGKATPEVKAASKSSSSAAPTPKPAREAPKGTGSGLLSSSDLFGGPGSASNGDGQERRGVNINLHIPLDPKGGNTINIAQEIVRKYGRDAINPRAAAHREQLLRVAARANALDAGSASANDDAMSVDLVSEGDADSNAGDNSTAAGGPDPDSKPPKKRKRKGEDYDKDDDFIDDTELAWQQGAAVAKDGFFVYSGPLVPEGTAPQIESTTTSTRGSRGRGRGRGRGGAGAATGTTHASLAERKAAAATPATNDSDAASTTATAAPTRSRGRGPGTGPTRHPRSTTAERERVEAEKAAAAAAGTASAPATHTGGPTGAPLGSSQAAAAAPGKTSSTPALPPASAALQSAFAAPGAPSAHLLGHGLQGAHQPNGQQHAASQQQTSVLGGVV